MKIACTGPLGRVGKFMVDNHGLTPLFVNVTDPDTIHKALDDERPHLILHTAGLSDPDYCEDPKNLNELVNVNLHGTTNVFRIAAERGIIVVFLSSAQVFSGKTFLGMGHRYKEHDVSHMRPVNQYGLSKVVAEASALPFGDRIKVVRTSHLFTYERVMDKMKDDVYAPAFIKRNYMYLPHFARALDIYLKHVLVMPDVLHIAGTDIVSEYDFLKNFVRTLDLRKYHIHRRTREVHDTNIAPRPHFAGLDVSLSRKIGLPQYSYIDGIMDMHRRYVRG